MIQENDSIQPYSFELEGDSVAQVRTKQITPADVLKWLPRNATPAQQDSAIQAHFKPKPIHWSEEPDTLSIPGIKVSKQKTLNLPSYKDNFFSSNPNLHPELIVTRQGISGDPVPYRLRSDDLITGTLLVSFILVAYVIMRSFHVLKYRVKQLFYFNRFDESYSFRRDSTLRSQLFLLFQCCFVLGILFFDFVQNKMVDVFNQVSPYKILSLNIIMVMTYFLVKWILYTFINWIFFDMKKNTLWIESYLLVVVLFGVVLFPIALLVVYFELSLTTLAILTICLLILAKIVLLRKYYQIFCAKKISFLLLFLYFCALEVLPILMLWRAMVYANKSLMIFF